MEYLSVAVIAALGVAAAKIIEALWKKNANKSEEHEFILQLTAANSKTNELLQQISYQLGANGAELKAINSKINGLSVRVDKLEDKVFKEESE